MLSGMMANDLGNNLKSKVPDSKKVKECVEIKKNEEKRDVESTQKPAKQADSIRQIMALPNGRLLIRDNEHNIGLFDIYSNSLIKSIMIGRIKSFKLISDNEFVIFRFDDKALLFDLNLYFLQIIETSHHISQLVMFNEDIFIGHQENERNHALFFRTSISKDTWIIQRNFLNAAGYDKISFLSPLGNDKIVAVYNNNLSVIEWSNKQFKRIGEMNFNVIHEYVYAVTKISDDLFIVCTSAKKTIDTLEKKEQCKHIRIFDTHTLLCIDDIILPKSAPIKEAKMLNDGKTLISWDLMMNPRDIYETKIDTHIQRTILMSKEMSGLAVLSNSDIAVLQDNKEIIKIELPQIENFKTQIKKEIVLQVVGSTNIIENVANLVASYSDDITLKPCLRKNNRIDEEPLKKDIVQKIKFLRVKIQFFFDKQLDILRVCQDFLENNLSDEKHFIDAISKYTSNIGENNTNEYIERTLNVIKERSENKLLKNFNLKLN